MSPATKNVDILLATYNGERFLREQLSSLEQQTFRSWRLVARDDGSSDATRTLLAEFRARHPSLVKLVEDGAGRLGPVGNYNRLLENSTAEYVLFSDQDDVWRPDKIEHLLRVAGEEERPGVPLLVHSDLEVVDCNLQVLAASFWRYQYINPAKCEWPRLLVQNVVTGCACLFNGALRRAALPIPAEAVMHDWWVALVAAISGKICWTAKPTVSYRQHGSNDTGAKRWGSSLWLKHTRGLFYQEPYRQRFLAYQRQAEALVRQGGGSISKPILATLQGFSTLNSRPYVPRALFLLRHGILKTGMLRNILLFKNL